MRFSVCVEMLFRDLPFLERLDRVAASGVGAYEFWRWRDKEITAIAERARRLGLACATLLGSDGGALVDPGQRAGFLEGMRGALEAARTVGSPTVIATVGQALPAMERGPQHDSIVAGLRAAAPMAADAGVTIVLEPLNTLVDHVGYYLGTTAEGAQIVDEVASPNVRLLYDVYHAQIAEGNLIPTMTANLARIAHVHVADHPGRAEPGSGEINYRNVFTALDAAGYAGYVGMEFRPRIDHAEAIRGTMALANPGGGVAP